MVYKNLFYRFLFSLIFFIIFFVVFKNQYLLFFLGNIPDPDLLIRTGGETRLSNFIMYNLTYSEIFFVDTLWPDFEKEELKKIIHKYNNINRTYGL